MIGVPLFAKTFICVARVTNLNEIGWRSMVMMHRKSSGHLQIERLVLRVTIRALVGAARSSMGRDEALWAKFGR
jgi:hypothetical protein